MSPFFLTVGAVGVIAGMAAGLVNHTGEFRAIPVQVFCEYRDEFRKTMWDVHGETPVIGAMVNRTGKARALLEIYVSRSGVFTAAITTSEGLSCMWFAGDTWTDTGPRCLCSLYLGAS